MERLRKLALWYQLSSAKYLGPLRFRGLWEKLGDDLEVVFSQTDKELLSWKGIVTTQNLPYIRGQKGKYRESEIFMEEQLRRAKMCGGRIVILGDMDYPDVLRKSSMCHPIVYCVGLAKEYADFDKSVAIVGTRRPAAKSRRLAIGTAEYFGKRDWVIVSGMAEGIDSAAHEGALKAHGRTIAVLGSGPDVIYPRGGRDLYYRIRENGLIISEFPFGTKPEDWKLKKRNKTTVALSLAAFVVQSGAKGGTMNAVKACKEQKKPIFSLAGDWEADWSGNNLIAQQGAIALKPTPKMNATLISRILRRYDLK